MRIILSDFMSVDGGVQAPGGRQEDTDGGFAHGGWSMPYFDAEATWRAVPKGPGQRRRRWGEGAGSRRDAGPAGVKACGSPQGEAGLEPQVVAVASGGLVEGVDLAG